MSPPEPPAGGPPRPLPPATLSDRAGAWFRWFGVTRMVAAALSTLIVVGGGWWLVRAPGLPAEQSLPVASVVASPSTLPPPATTAVTAPPTTVSAANVVHVAGAVAAPGVYTLSSESRIDDAIAMAGGATGAADLDGLNLAAPLVDGQRVYVPEQGEVDPASVAMLPSVAEATASASTTPVGPVDINRADQPTLERLPGVGPATASAIILDRQTNGPFASIDDLERVPGIGPAKLAQLRDLVTV